MSNICLVCGCNAVLCAHNTAYPESLLKLVFGDCTDYFEQISKLVVDDATISRLSGSSKIELRHGRYIIKPGSQSIVAKFGNATVEVPFIDIGFCKHGVKFFIDGVEYDLSKGGVLPATGNDGCVSNESSIGLKAHENGCMIGSKKIRTEDVISEVVGAVCGGELEIESAVNSLFDFLTENMQSNSVEIAELKKAYERGKISAVPVFLVILSYFPHASDAGEQFRLPFTLDDDLGMLIFKNYAELFTIVRLGACNLFPDRLFRIHLSELCKTKVNGTSVWDIVVKNIYKISPVSDKRYINEVKPFLDRLFQ